MSISRRRAAPFARFARSRACRTASRSTQAQQRRGNGRRTAGARLSGHQSRPQLFVAAAAGGRRRRPAPASDGRGAGRCRAADRRPSTWRTCCSRDRSPARARWRYAARSARTDGGWRASLSSKACCCRRSAPSSALVVAQAILSALKTQPGVALPRARRARARLARRSPRLASRRSAPPSRRRSCRSCCYRRLHHTTTLAGRPCDVGRHGGPHSLAAGRRTNRAGLHPRHGDGAPRAQPAAGAGDALRLRYQRRHDACVDSAATLSRPRRRRRVSTRSSSTTSRNSPASRARRFRLDAAAVGQRRQHPDDPGPRGHSDRGAARHRLAMGQPDLLRGDGHSARSAAADSPTPISRIPRMSR